MIQKDLKEAKSNYESLKRIQEAYKEYKVPEDLLNEDQKDKLFVILLGVTGVGKSTLFNFLRGAKMKITKTTLTGAEIDLENDLENQQFKIGHGNLSQTMEPAHYCFKHNGQEMIVVDTPGYGATQTNNYTKQEQQWLDSLKMRKYFKKCKKCILLLVMKEEQLTERSSQFDLSEFLNYIQSLTGISEKSQLIKKIRIIFNKSQIGDDQKDKEEFIQDLRENKAKLVQESEKPENQQKQEGVNQKDKKESEQEDNFIQNLQYFIEILENKNNQNEFEFQAIRQITRKHKVNEYSQEKRKQILNFIQNLKPLEMSPQPHFQNKDKLGLYIKNIQVDLYKIEVDNLFVELDCITDEIMKQNKKIVVSDHFLIKSKEYFKNWFRSKKNQKEVLCYDTLKENHECLTIHQIMNCLVQCYDEVMFQQAIIKQQGVVIEFKNDYKILRKRIKKFPTTQLQSLIDLANKYKNRNYKLEDFIKYYEIIIKFSHPKQMFTEGDVVQHSMEMLLTSQIRDKIKKQIQKISQFTDKLNNLIFGMDFQIEFEIKVYITQIIEGLIQNQILITLFTNVYKLMLLVCQDQQTKLENFIKNDGVTSRYKNDDFTSGSTNHQALNADLKFFDDWGKKKDKVIRKIFNVPENSVIDGTKLKELLEAHMKKLASIRTRLEEIQKERDKYQINEQDINTLKKLMQEQILEKQAQKFVDLLVDLNIYDHKDQDYLGAIKFIIDNCFLWGFSGMKFWRSKGEYSKDFFNPALDKVKPIIERIKRDLDKIEEFEKQQTENLTQEQEGTCIKIECNPQ